LKQNSVLILASNSPRRQQLLKEAGINFLIRVKDIPELYPPELPVNDIPVFLSKLKSKAFQNEITNETVLTADTIVSLNGKVLGKPVNLKEAEDMLEELSGKMHEVVTGVTIFNKQKELSFSNITKVYFKELSKEAIRFYVQNYKPLDKAGSYGIQEWIGLTGIEKIEGSYFNVMGLPVHRVVEELGDFGFSPSYEHKLTERYL
jgi:septum formation protein